LDDEEIIEALQKTRSKFGSDAAKFADVEVGHHMFG
jgi:hypothetical protein